MIVPIPPLRILCVEDDPLALKALAAGLEAYHFKVTDSDHGCHAVVQVRSAPRKFDIVLTNHNMMGMDGLKVVGSLRALKFTGLVLIMYDQLTVSEWRTYRFLKVSGFFKKPFEASLIAELLLNDLHVKRNPSS